MGMLVSLIGLKLLNYAWSGCVPSRCLQRKGRPRAPQLGDAFQTSGSSRDGLMSGINTLLSTHTHVHLMKQRQTVRRLFARPCPNALLRPSQSDTTVANVFSQNGPPAAIVASHGTARRATAAQPSWPL